MYNGQKHARHGSAHTHIREGEREPFLANQLAYNGQARGLSAKGHIINVSLPGIILNEADQGLFDWENKMLGRKIVLDKESQFLNLYVGNTQVGTEWEKIQTFISKQ